MDERAIDRLRKRIERATESPVPEVKDWAVAMREVLLPVIDLLIDAERRAAAAEAEVANLRRKLAEQ